MDYIFVGGVKNANDSLTMAFELVACDSSPTIYLFDSVGFVVLDVRNPRVHESAVSSGHSAFPGE